jgi:hypothetical protein
MQLATFWSGPLSPLEIACMLSFVDHGHTMTLYSFARHELPDTIEQKPADEIVDASFLRRFRTDGRPNIAHFADLFRLLLFKKTDCVWVDCDILCLASTSTIWSGDVIVQEAGGSIINCVLRISDRALLDEAIRLTETFLDKDVVWAATQNVLPRAMAQTSYAGGIVDASLFSPIDVDDWYRLLLPEHRDACIRLCANAHTVHLYNNVLQKVGYLKSALPPPGSYLRILLEERGVASLFAGAYDEETIRALAANWQFRFSGNAIGFGALTRQIVPSLRRTFSRRRFR